MRRPLAVLFGALTLLAGYRATADDHVTLRTQYYREPSTRVVQPVVEIEKDLPYGFDVLSDAGSPNRSSAILSAGKGPSPEKISV